jgi:SAM-dependent methyltransferase
MDSEAYLSFEELTVATPAVNVVVCPICWDSCDHYPAHGVSRCNFCQHTFQTDLAVAVSYDAAYAHQYDLRPVRQLSDLRWEFIQSRLRLPVASRVLDVGYGNGAFLKRARAADMAIFGIDLHSEDFGIPVVGFETRQDYDLVCFFDSLEHFPDFAPILHLSTRFVVVSIPNTPDFILTTPRKWRHFKPGEHLHYFSRASLDALMLSWGFRERLADGFPEDDIRGKLAIDGKRFDNIYTAIYARR